MRQRGRRLPIN